MRWSKLKQITEARFADGVRGRVELWSTTYRTMLSRIEGFEKRSWITIDGRPIINMHRFLEQDGIYACVDEERFLIGIYDGWDLYWSARAMLTTSIEDALFSTNSLLQALAILDRRVGKRRLATLDVDQQVPLVRQLIQFRLGAVGSRLIA